LQTDDEYEDETASP
jgi:hypothetical protein